MQLVFLEVREASPPLSAGIDLREAAGSGAPSACWTERPPSAPNAVRSRYSALKSEACWQDGGVADPATTRSPLR